MKRIVSITGLLAVGAGIASADLAVTTFGDYGWYSGDTRNSAGTNLRGTNYTHANYGGTYSGADDTAIASQIKWLGEGDSTVTSWGLTPNASPTGSLNGLGYVRLDATNDNHGKATISIYNPNGFGLASDMLGANFAASYSYYSDPEPTNRTPGYTYSIARSGGFNTLVYVDPANTSGGVWRTASMTYTSGLWTLYGTGANGTISMTLQDWANDGTWGSVLFGANSVVYESGFNLGSSQRNNLSFIDWVQSTAFYSGERVDFQAAAVPEPTLITVAGFGLVGILRRRNRR